MQHSHNTATTQYCPNTFPQHPPMLSVPMHRPILPYQPIHLIPISAVAPYESANIDMLNRQIQQSTKTIAPKISVSYEPPSARKPLASIDDRELRRRVKKQNMERRRRACISDKLSALHSLAVSLVGETPQQQTNQRTEITDILNQCVSVLEGLSEFVKNDPELQAKMHRLGGPLRGEPSVKNKVPPECDNDNSRIPSAFTPVGRQPPFTSTPLVPRENRLREPKWVSPLCPQNRKRQSTDSGCCVSEVSTSTPSTAFPEPPSKKPRQPTLWRPYLD